MAKNSVIISVSVDRKQAEFLDDKNLSPSDLIQQKINEQIALFESYNKESNVLRSNIQSLHEEIGNLHSFIDVLGKFDEYRKWRGSHVLEKKG